MVQNKRFDVEMDGDVTIVRLNDPRLHEMILITELHDELLAVHRTPSAAEAAG